MHMTGFTRTARFSHDRIIITGPAGIDVVLHHADGTPVEFLAGAPEVTGFFAGFHPIYLLDVMLADGTARTYFVDRSGIKLGEEPEVLSDQMLASLQHSLLGPDHPSASFHRPNGEVGRLDAQFLADIIFVTDVPDAAGLRLRSGEGDLYALTGAFGLPIAAFEPGWRARFLFTGFAPLHVLELLHQDGRQANWYLSSEGNFFSHVIDVIPELFRRRIAVFGARRFLEDGRPDGLLGRGFGFLNWRARLELEPFFPSVPVQPVRGAAIAVHAGPAMMPVASMTFESQLMHPPSSEALVLVEQIDTEASVFDQGRLGSGWSFREGRCWATSQDNVVHFALPFAARMARLRIDFQPGRSRRSVTVTVNGWAIGSSVIDLDRGEDSRRDFWIPAQAMKGLAIRCVLSFDSADDHHACIVRGIRLELGSPSGQAEMPDQRTLMTGFENIGDNCEFGLVQRYFGAEPLGLLRFADYGDFFNLIRLLENRFDGLGGVGTLSAQVVSSIARLEHGALETGSEFYLSDLQRRYSFHTWKGQFDYKGGADHQGKVDQGEAEALSEAEHKLSYLRRKMIERLEQASRIWLIKRTRHTDPHEIFSLHAALKAYGPNRLFWVRSAKPGRPAGSVEWIAEGLLCGYSDQDHLHPHVFDPVRWLALCENAHRSFADKLRENAPHAFAVR